ncbi:MAG TPA: MFS transporter [Gemmatimonadales bacterium]|jgi:MFS family permease|nr:MFS transporter [Gemmatimonadales bacterium]
MPEGPEPLPSHRRPALPSAFGALRHRNFRLFYSGQLVSLAGTWMGNTAQAWLVLVLTDSPFYVGLVGALGSLPVLLLALFAGTVADRMSKLRLVMITQASSMVLAFAMAALVLTDRITVSQIIVIATLMGAVNAFDVPARQSFFVEMVGKDDLMNAIALNSSAFNVTRVLGPAVAGVVIGKLGVGVCFLLNGLSFLAVLTALFAIRLPPYRRAALPPSTWAHIREGLRYVTGDRRVSAIVLNIAALSIFGYPFLVLMPVVARDVLGKGAVEFGWMSSAVGAGALAGALMLAAFARRLPKGRMLRWASTGFGIILFAFSLSRSLPLSLAVLVMTGFVLIVNTATTNTLLQTLTPDELRGRVMSVFTLAFVGMGPIGALQAGILADRIGAPTTLMVGALVCVLITFVLFRRVRQVGELR